MAEVWLQNLIHNLRHSNSLRCGGMQVASFYISVIEIEGGKMDSEYYEVNSDCGGSSIKFRYTPLWNMAMISNICAHFGTITTNIYQY